MAYRRALLALATCVLVTACGGGSPCEDYCAEAKDCENMSLVPGEDCAKACEDAIDQVEEMQGCGAEFEDMLDCAADSDDVCRPTDCTSEALDYVDCAQVDDG
jgi:hypothetical protein